MDWPLPKKTLTNRVLLLIATAILFNLVFSALLFVGSGSYRLARNDSVENFAASVARDAEYLGLRLGKDAVHTVARANSMDQQIRRLAHENHIRPVRLADSEDTLENVLEIAMGELRSVLPADDCTSAFFIPLAGGDGPLRESGRGLYLRSVPFGPLGLQTALERGPRSLAPLYGARVMRGWKEELEIDRSQPGGDFLEKLLDREYRDSHATRDDGYWTRPGDPFGMGEESVHFVVPLLDDDKSVYAVLGVGLTLGQLAGSVIPGGDGVFDAAYYLVPSSLPEKGPEWRVGKRFIPIGDGTEIIDHPPTSIIELFGGASQIGEYEPHPSHAESGGYMAALRRLGLYTAFSPYADEDFALVGYAKRADVLGKFHRSVRNTGLSLLAATLLAAAAVHFLVRRRVKRIISATRRLGDTRRVSGEYHFEKTDIDEIDALTSTLEELNKRVHESALRVSTIFDMLEMPIGCYEYEKAKPDLVFVTPSLYTMLGLKNADDEKMFVEMDRWRAVYDRLKSRPYRDAPNTYEWGGEAEGGTKFFRLEEVERSGYVVGIVTDVTNQMKATRELRQRANYDGLTRLMNRQAFRSEALRRIAEKPELKGVMMFGDLDGLKRVNDEFGHSQGDRFIQAAADWVRSLELIGGVVARLSGDEFAVYLHGFPTAEAARTALYTHLLNVPPATVRLPDGTSREVKMSRGVALYPEDSADYSELLSCADRAMYQAKYSNKGSVVEYGQCHELDNASVLRDLQDELVRIVDGHDFGYAYQPVRDLNRDRVMGYTAYLRPRSVLLADPRRMLETALMLNLQGRIGRMLLEDNLEMLRSGHPEAPGRLLLKSMKYSLLADRDYDDLRVRYAEEFHRVDVLIPTESKSDMVNIENKIRMCHLTGARIAFDDFVVNDADSLDFLELGPDLVRIRMERIRVAGEGGVFSRVVEACRRRGVQLLATEVETDADLALAKKWNFDLAQGYLFGAPGPDCE